MVAVSGYRFVRYNGTDWCDALVPIRPLQWYRLERYAGTDWSDALVPIHPLQWYRFADIITCYPLPYFQYIARYIYKYISFLKN